MNCPPNYNYARMSAPVKYGDYFYFFKNSGLQNEDVMYRMKNPETRLQLNYLLIQIRFQTTERSVSRVIIFLPTDLYLLI